MSMEAIHEALAMLEVVAGGPGVVRQAVDAAKKATREIERAAVDFTEAESMDEVAIDTVTCFERITKEVVRRTLAGDSSGPSGERP